MTASRDHYERLLAHHYSWMFGVPFEEKVREQAELLKLFGVGDPGHAVDLGCGSGFQAVALADLGAVTVHAIDISAALLAELRDHAGGRPIVTHEIDLLQFEEVLDTPADTIICMGDTLTHLSNQNDVLRLFGAAANRLKRGGRLVLSWRDLSSPPQGLDRFIPLRATDDKVMVCFLEDQGQTVRVHDFIHVREADGWRFHKSAYSKLKLPLAWITEQLASVGLIVDMQRTLRGMHIVAAVR